MRADMKGMPWNFRREYFEVECTTLERAEMEFRAAEAGLSLSSYVLQMVYQFKLGTSRRERDDKKMTEGFREDAEQRRRQSALKLKLNEWEQLRRQGVFFFRTGRAYRDCWGIDRRPELYARNSEKKLLDLGRDLFAHPAKLALQQKSRPRALASTLKQADRVFTIFTDELLRSRNEREWGYKKKTLYEIADSIRTHGSPWTGLKNLPEVVKKLEAKHKRELAKANEDVIGYKAPELPAEDTCEGDIDDALLRDLQQGDVKKWAAVVSAKSQTKRSLVTKTADRVSMKD